jgi:quercetin dioxygenase-like cupin family protein
VKRRGGAIALATSIACVLAAAPAAAQQRTAQEGASFRVLSLETLSPEIVLSAAETEIEPGYSAASHRHQGSVFVYVLEGAIRSRVNDEPIELYEAGGSWFEADGDEHSFFENASSTEPARFLVVRVGPPQQAAPR